ncbi:conserved hypothetical protein [Methylobacterium nodulans ORS 2060]|uniref:Uncharacterized protein n=1 Tax=Methylobacterium nodulans (strain LMG 21967 / CNCM I-2342 / ORS 2060) TaxID=460265 RepID=B8IRH4_METNO|nr:conserved hypothetical protein [Methylobacterium nodulans ORS 2060]
MKRERRTRSEIADMILEHLRSDPGGERVISFRFTPSHDYREFPGFVVNFQSGNDDEKLAVAHKIIKLIYRFYGRYDVRDFITH